MTTEAFKAKERIREARDRAGVRQRTLAWRTDFRRQQVEAKATIKKLLSLPGISQTDWYYLYIANQNRRGPRADQIKRVGKLWVKYGLAGEEDG